MAAPFKVLFTDLDGTLLDERTYAYAAALPALQALQARHIVIVPCTSKTFAETVVLQEAMGLSGPCIVENGGAVYFPHDQVPEGSLPLVRCGTWSRLELGLTYTSVVQGLASVQDGLGLRVIGFSQMEPAEIAAASGLTLKAAARCKLREFDEPFQVMDATPEDLDRLAERARSCGFTLTTGGRYHHLSGGTDKGRAVRTLCECLAPSHGPFRTAGIGDSPNDLPMLQAVDVPVVVMRPDGRHHGTLLAQLPHALQAPGVGPEGWNRAVLDLLAREVADAF